GGMLTKLQAAQIAAEAGVETVITRARRPGVIAETIAGGRNGTRVPSRPNPLRGRKRWIAFGGPAQGAIQVNLCAREALTRGGVSLLPGGIIGVEGEFRAGDTVALIDESRAEFGRGIVTCDAADVLAVMGAHTG